jgi:NADH:ubiquinone oxidoreductase subunit K
MVVRGQSEIFFTFIIFVFGACEASLGLACLVSIIRTFGRDQFKIINSLKC